MSLISFLRNAEQRPLSDSDLRHITRNPRLKVIPYHELPKYTRLEDCFNGNNYCIILLESAFNNGHYIALCYNQKNNELSFNDSYGQSHDKLIRKLDYYTHTDNGEYFLNRLIRDFKNRRQCTYVQNTQTYQYLSNQVNTCGRYAAIRCVLNFMTLSQYNKSMIDLMEYLKMSPDDLISLLTLISGIV